MSRLEETAPESPVSDPPVRICFVSGHEFGHQALGGLLGSDEHASGRIEISLVMSLDDSQRSDTVGYARFDDLARQAGAEHIRVRDATLTDHCTHITAALPDYLLVIGWSRLIPPLVLDVPARVRGARDRHSQGHGCIGMHPSPLPEGRGRAPIPWSIIKNLRKSALSVFLLEEQADAGPIVMQLPVTIEETETAATLFNKFLSLHFRAGHRLAPLMAQRQVRATPQMEANATVWPRRRPSDGRIDFAQDSQSIERLVRALMPPYPPATLIYGNRQVRVLAVRVHSVSSTTQPGTVIGLRAERIPLIATKDGAVELLSFECDTPLNFTVGGTCS